MRRLATALLVATLALGACGGGPRELTALPSDSSHRADSTDADAGEAAPTTSAVVPAPPTTVAAPAVVLPGTVISAPQTEQVAQPAVETPTTAPSPFPIAEGATGDLVLQFQTSLSAAGYDLGYPDGSFGPRTAEVTRQFQFDLGVAQTGTIDQALFDASRLAASQAPPCTAQAVQAAYGQLQNGFEWSDFVQCAPGWAVATSWLVDTAVSEYTLFQVRGSQWQLVGAMQSREPTIALSSGTPLSARRFSQLFGATGWPYRASNADEVARFVMSDAFDQSGTLPGAWELVQMYLDNYSFEIWNDWLYEHGGQGDLQPCQDGGGYWRCEFYSPSGLNLIVSVEADLLHARIDYMGG